MSDLLPLVATVLRDKVVVDAQEELAQLQRQLRVSRSVEVVRADPDHDGDDDDDDDYDEDGPVTVYASSQFENGIYHLNPNLWRIDFKKPAAMDDGATTCRLKDLRDCRICVGGGFPLESLDDNQPGRPSCNGSFDLDDDSDSDNSKLVRFCFSPNTVWLTILVHGWPRAEWEATVEADNVDSEDVIRFLVEEVAVNHPEATVEFLNIALTVRSIHGALKRLLPPRRKEQVRADRDALNSEVNRAYSHLKHYVAIVMRDLGNQDGPALFVPKMEEIMGFLLDLGIVERNNGNEQFITTVVTAYERHGRETVRAAVDRVLERAQSAGEDENQDVTMDG